jgi:hypothetical protein
VGYAASRKNARGQSPRALCVWPATVVNRAARAGYACSRRISSPPRKPASPGLRSGFGVTAARTWSDPQGSDLGRSPSASARGALLLGPWPPPASVRGPLGRLPRPRPRGGMPSPGPARRRAPAGRPPPGRIHVVREVRAPRGSRPAGGAKLARKERRRPDSNWCTRLCRPLPNHSATAPRRRMVSGRFG